MAMNNTDEKYKVNGKASWDLAVYLNRQNPLPLDGTSIYNSYAEAEAYARENAKAYPGQIISVVTEKEVKVYKINNGKLEELGKGFLVTDQNPTLLAKADNIGQIIYLTTQVKVNEESGEVTYSPGPYIVSGVGTVSKIGTTSVSGDIAGVVAALQGNVSTLESTVGKKVDKTDITQSTGTSTTTVMSQKATTKVIHEILYDVTTNNSGATFASLSALLSSENISTLIPISVRYGGMSIRFVQSSDNKYVQYRYICTNITDNTFTDINNWLLSGATETNLFSYIKYEVTHTSNFNGTNFSLLKKAIKKIYWKQIPTERGHYLTNFGYYATGNIFYGQLRASDESIVALKSYNFDDFDGVFEIGDLVVIVNKYLFTEQHYLELSDNCYLPEISNQAITTDKIANQAITTDKIANQAITTDKIAYNAVTNEKLSSSVEIITEIGNLGIEKPDCFYSFNNRKYLESQGIWTTFMFNVQPGKSYTICAYAGQDARLWNLFDSENNFISASSDDSLAHETTETITIPSNCYKLIVNNRYEVKPAISVIGPSVKIDASQIYIDNAPIKDYIDTRLYNTNYDKLYGKVLVCAGDSITYGADMDAEGIVPVSLVPYYYRSGDSYTQVAQNVLANYGYQIASRHNMTFYNEGISGSTMQGLPNRDGFSLENGRYTTLPEHIDYLTIWFGWNDTAYGSLGTIDDATNDSYYGGYNVVLPYLINKYPYIKICLCVPFGCDEGHRQAIRNLANKWGVACWDNYLGGTPLYFGKESSVGVNSTIVSHNQRIFQANGAHPNFKGHKQIADMLEHFLQGI